MPEKTTEEKDQKAKAVPRLATRNTGKKRALGKIAETAYSERLVDFWFRAPWASHVFLAGCFNKWDPQATPLQSDEDGTWTCSVSIEPGDYQYRFIVDGEWEDDPLNARRCRNGFGTENCVLTVEP